MTERLKKAMVANVTLGLAARKSLVQVEAALASLKEARTLSDSALGLYRTAQMELEQALQAEPLDD